MGARFVVADAVMQPIVREAAKRGLGYFDDGSAPRSVAPALAAAQAMPFAKADLTIDAVPTAVEIDRALANLEGLAKERGIAVGIASALPISIERIGVWTRTLESHGVMLVPLTTAMLKSKSGLRLRTCRRSARPDRSDNARSLTARGFDGMARYEDLPYRTCVGMMLINAAGLVFIGRRAGGIEHVDESHVWQMPQGGVDPGEDTWAAAKRELYEETSVRSVEKLGEVADWLIYDIPRTVAGRAWKGRYRGQRQKWYAVRFTGEDAEINVASPGGGHKAEFVSWRWEPMKNLPDLIVPFKRPVYERVVKEFSQARRRLEVQSFRRLPRPSPESRVFPSDEAAK